MASLNKFTNDGSFMERFLKEQEEKKKNEEEISDKKQPISVPPAKKPMIGRIGGLKKKPVQNRQITPQKVHKVFRDDSDSEPEEKKESKSSSSGPSAPPEDDISKAISEAVERAKRVAKLAGDQSSSQQSSSSAAVPRKRKSRWGDEARDEDRSINSAIASFSGSSSLTPEQQRQLIEQQEMAKLVASIQSATQRKGKGGKSDQYEYDSDEDTDGGTWEHKKRMQEMRKTLDKAKQLTAEGKGKHFIGDFLPPDELEKFLEKVQALKEGRDPDFSDYAKYKLGEDNIGYQLLQKAGWSDGLGLGAKEDGRTVPVNKGKQSLDNSGVGTEGVGEIKKEDDEFDVYRKRMMLAYRFRPNPLNNPRRPYY